VAIESVTSVRPRVGSARDCDWSLRRRFPKHLAAYVAQQSKCHPVVISADAIGHAAAGQPAEDRHEELEQAEVERQAEDVPRRDLFQDQAGRDGHREGVHGESDGKAEEGKQGHGVFGVVGGTWVEG